MMLALWIAVTLRRPWRTACRKANSAIRVEARAVMTLTLSTTPGEIWCSMPAYRSSVFSRTTTRSTAENSDLTPAMLRIGRRFE